MRMHTRTCPQKPEEERDPELEFQETDPLNVSTLYTQLALFTRAMSPARKTDVTSRSMRVIQTPFCAELKGGHPGFTLTVLPQECLSL